MFHEPREGVETLGAIYPKLNQGISYKALLNELSCSRGVNTDRGLENPLGYSKGMVR
jgi:hypothetical protein